MQNGELQQRSREVGDVIPVLVQSPTGGLHVITGTRLVDVEGERTWVIEVGDAVAMPAPDEDAPTQDAGTVASGASAPPDPRDQDPATSQRTVGEGEAQTDRSE